MAGWRWLLILAAGGLGVWLLRRRLPESPRWLAATGNTAEADRVVTAIERDVLPAGQPVPPPAPEVPPATAPRVAESRPAGRYRRRTVLCG